jgi:S-adenosylmethionine decarboxylase
VAPPPIRDGKEIRAYVIQPCDLIEMKRLGECQGIHFGQDAGVAGYSMCQLIEISMISSHFDTLTNAAYIGIFSCQLYEPREVSRFLKAFFEARAIEVHVTRGM